MHVFVDGPPPPPMEFGGSKKKKAKKRHLFFSFLSSLGIVHLLAVILLANLASTALIATKIVLFKLGQH